MAIPSSFLLLLILSLVDGGFSANDYSTDGCNSTLKAPYTFFCHLNAVWGLVLAQSAAALASLVLALVLLCRLRQIENPVVRSGVMPLLVLLTTLIGLCGLSFAYLAEREENICSARRALWAVLVALLFACLVFQCLRLRWLAQRAYSPGGGALAGLVVAFLMLDPQWYQLTQVYQGHQLACQYNQLDLGMACIYMPVLLSIALVAAACSLRGWHRQLRCSPAWLLSTCLASALLWVGWLTFAVQGKGKLSLSDTLDDQAQAVVLVIQVWLLLVLYATPEVYSISQVPPRIREVIFEEGLPL